MHIIRNPLNRAGLEPCDCGAEDCRRCKPYNYLNEDDPRLVDRDYEEMLRDAESFKTREVKLPI